MRWLRHTATVQVHGGWGLARVDLPRLHLLRLLPCAEWLVVLLDERCRALLALRTLVVGILLDFLQGHAGVVQEVGQDSLVLIRVVPALDRHGQQVEDEGRLEGKLLAVYLVVCLVKLGVENLLG